MPVAFGARRLYGTLRGFEGAALRWNDSRYARVMPARYTMPSAGLSHQLVMPYGRADDLWVAAIFLPIDGSTTVTWPSSPQGPWTTVATIDWGSTHRLVVAQHVVTGSETSRTVTVTLNQSRALTGIAMTIESMAVSTALESITGGGSANPSFGFSALTPSWGSSRTLWLAVLGWMSGSTPTGAQITDRRAHRYVSFEPTYTTAASVPGMVLGWKMDELTAELPYDQPAMPGYGSSDGEIFHWLGPTPAVHLTALCAVRPAEPSRVAIAKVRDEQVRVQAILDTGRGTVQSLDVHNASTESIRVLFGGSGGDYNQVVSAADRQSIDVSAAKQTLDQYYVSTSRV